MVSDAPKKPPSPKRDTALIMLACTAAAGACIQLTQGSEGFVAKARPDPVGIPTGCFGETTDIDLARIYSRSECVDKLRRRLAASYAPKLAACLPQLTLQGRSRVFGAYLDAAYNAGPTAVCGSRMAQALRAGDLRGACNFDGWYVTARDRRTGRRIQLNGLVVRRQKESALCRS